MTDSLIYNFSQNLNQEKAPTALYVVATPIGNLEDITLRALRILSTVSQIACEDTRISCKLLNHYQIKKKLISYNDFSDSQARTDIIDLILKGESVALISDAGTPLISDPGYKLVFACIEEGISVIPIPGPSALTASLSACGLSTDQFFFYGFMPKKEKEMVEAFEKMAALNTTIVCYESPNRLLKTLVKMQLYFSESFEICVAREITKKFETFKKGSLKELIIFFESSAVKGEIVLIFNTKKTEIVMSEAELITLIQNYDPTVSTKIMANDLSKSTKISKRILYNLILKHRA